MVSECSNFNFDPLSCRAKSTFFKFFVNATFFDNLQNIIYRKKYKRSKRAQKMTHSKSEFSSWRANSISTIFVARKIIATKASHTDKMLRLVGRAVVI